MAHRVPVTRYLGRWAVVATHPQMNHLLMKAHEYNLTPGSQELSCVLREVQHEAVTLSQLHHDGVLNFRGVVNMPDTDSPMYILFELASDSLRGYVNKLDRKLTLREVKRVAVDVLSALTYLAASGVIHRDLKPENVLVFARGDGYVSYKVGDVGLAKFVANRTSAALSRCTASSGMSVAGTPLYRAPEVGDISKRYDAKVDVFSVGVMLIELIACHVMPAARFTSYISPEQFLDMKDAVLAYLSEVGCGELAGVIDACVARKAKNRLSATEALARVEAAAVPGTGASDKASVASDHDEVGRV